MTFLKGDVDGLTYFHWFSVILNSNQNHPCFVDLDFKYCGRSEIKINLYWFLLKGGKSVNEWNVHLFVLKILGYSIIHSNLNDWVQFKIVGLMVFNTTFNNISVISWRSVLLVEETGLPRENSWPVASHWQTLSILRHKIEIHILNFVVGGSYYCQF